MDRDLFRWLGERREEIYQRWRTLAREAGYGSKPGLEHSAQGDVLSFDRVSGLALTALGRDELLESDELEALVKAWSQHDLSALLSTLGQAVRELLLEQCAPAQAAELWMAANDRIDRFAMAIAGARDRQLASLETELKRWQALYGLNRELSASIDVSYVLEHGLARILDTLGAQRGAVLLLDAETEAATPRVAQDWLGASLRLADLPVAWQRGHGKPLVLQGGEATGGVFEPLFQDRGETIVMAPLLANGRLHGLLAVATTDAGGLHAQQWDLLEAIVNNLASSLGNVEVIQTLHSQARELGLMLRHQQEESSKREAILASIADGVVFNDQHGLVVLVNRAAEQILAARAGELIEHDLNDLFALFTAGAREELVQAMRAVLANPKLGLTAENTQTVLQIDNHVVNAHFAPVITAQDEFLGIVTVLRDITKEVEADRAKNEFVSTVSHELRTPLTAIKGYTDLLYSGMVGAINAEQQRFLGIIRSNADRLTALISDLLDISRVETGRVRFEPEPVRLGDIITTVIDALAPNAERKGHTLTYRAEAGLPEIMGDPDRLNQVFTNLLGNAINYTPDGGDIAVDVYRVQGALRVDVTDNGIGIYAKDMHRVFERFYRGDHPVVQESRGTGLGLSIVKIFTEMHGGRVWVESEAGQGSTFTVLLPLPTGHQMALPDLLGTEPLAKFDKRRILVADDDADIADLVKLQLEAAGYRVTVVGRGAKVFEVARRRCPDLIVLDILLPDMDGRAVLEMLKSDPATADIPVVMLTVVADDGTASDLGAAGYLTKPIDGEQLLAAARLALARRGRVLVVEDDLDTIEVMRVALRRVGYNVDVAADGYDAMSLARRWRPQAIVLDLRLPGMDGYETLSHLRRGLNTQDIPIIVTSAHVADWELEEKRLKLMGVVSVLPKPFTVNQLVSAIDRAINRVRSTQTQAGMQPPV